jgi:hypothetical protein
MKKVLLSTALLAAVISTSAAKFDGTYVKGEVLYSATSLTFKDKVNDTKYPATKLKGFGGLASVGYGDNCGSVYLGGEAYLGKVSANKKITDGTETVKTTRGINAGVAGRVGGHINDMTLAYFRLGLDYAHYDVKYTDSANTGNNFKKNLTVWSVVPGIGMDMKVSHNMFVTAGVDYAVAFKASVPSSVKALVGYSKKPQSLTFRLGAGYQF